MKWTYSGFISKSPQSGSTKYFEFGGNFLTKSCFPGAKIIATGTFDVVIWYDGMYKFDKLKKSLPFLFNGIIL